VSPFRQRFQVRSYELDSLGHLNNAIYFSYLEEATWRAMAEKGLPFSRFAELGWWPIVVHASLDFRKELLPCDVVEVIGWPERYGETSITLAYRLERPSDGALIAEGRRVWVVTRTGEGKIPVPDEIRSALGPAESS
jgi:acyl-CoA thioester hydrolase